MLGIGMGLPVASPNSLVLGHAAGAEASPPTGYTGWFKASLAASPPTDKFSDAGTTPAVNGGTIYQWSNQTGSNHMLQTVALRRPTYNTSLTLNGFAGVTFDGAIQKIQAALDNSPFTFAVVGRFLGADPSGASGRIVGYGGERSLYQDLINVYGLYYTSGSGNVMTSVPITTNVAAIVRWEPGVSNQVRINAANAGALTPNAAAATTGAMTLGANGNTGGGGANEEGYCIVYEAIHYPYIISASELTALETYLQAKFGLW